MKNITYLKIPMTQLIRRCYLLKLQGTTDFYIKYVNKQTKNMYIKKKTTAKAEFNPKSIKNLFNVRTTFKNLFHNFIQNITNLRMFMTWPTRRCYLLKLQGPTDYCYEMYKQKQKNKIYINKQTNNTYINKQATAKAGFNLNSIKKLSI